MNDFGGIFMTAVFTKGAKRKQGIGEVIRVSNGHGNRVVRIASWAQLGCPKKYHATANKC